MVIKRKEQRGLPAGTQVQMRSQAWQKGTVMPYEPEYSPGRFPVRLDNCIWQTCNVSDVIVLAPPKEADQ